MLNNKNNALDSNQNLVVHFQEGDYYTVSHFDKGSNPNEKIGVFERRKKEDLFGQLCHMVSTGEVVEMSEDLENRAYSLTSMLENGASEVVKIYLHDSDYNHNGNGVGLAFHALYEQYQENQIKEGKLFYSNLHGQLQVNWETVKESVPAILCIAGLAAVIAINHMSDDSPAINFVRNNFLKKDNQYSASERPGTYLTDAVQNDEFATFTWPSDDGMEEVSIRKR